MVKLTSLLLSFLLSLVIFSSSYADNTVSNMLKCRSYVLAGQNNEAYKFGKKLIKQYPMNPAGYYCLGFEEFTAVGDVEKKAKTAFYYFEKAKKLLEQSSIVDQNANLMIYSLYMMLKPSVIPTSSDFKKNEIGILKALSEVEDYAKVVENNCFTAGRFTCYTSYLEIHLLYHTLGFAYKEMLRDTKKACGYYLKASSAISDTLDFFNLTKLGEIDRATLIELKKESTDDVRNTCVRIRM